jgi:hypothetical protein
MNEAQRLAYLQALGIETFRSRLDLPGALPSKRMRVVRRRRPPAQPAAASARQALQAPVSPQHPGRNPRSPAPPFRPEASGKAAAAGQPMHSDGVDEMPIFTLAVATAGGCLWLDSLPPGRNPGPEYAQLLDAVARSLNLPEGEIDVSRFDFPISGALRLGRDLAAARDALHGYLVRRLEQLSARTVVLLGDLDQPWFNRECLGDCRVISTVSAWRMLREPKLKAVAWADLQPLRGNED